MSTVTEMAAARAQALASADEPMTIAEAIGKAQFLRLQPECVVSALEARRVIDALLSAIQSSPTFHKALLAGEEVFVLRQRDRAAPSRRRNAVSDRWNAALEAAADRLRTRACGYLARHDTIYNGRIVSEELLELAKAILALREADPVHPSAKPFKCPHCGSHCFGPTWRGKEVAGRYCKGWPSDEDRSYKLCPAKYVEWYGQADQRGAAATCTEGASSETGESQNRASDGKLEAQSAPHHPGGQPVAWTTVLSLELAKGAFYASPVNLWAEKGIPIYTHPGGQEKADGKVAGDAGTTVDSPEAARIPLGMVLVPRDRIEGLLEYWNGNPNERAMWDALTHIQTELQAMLTTAAEEERNET